MSHPQNDKFLEFALEEWDIARDEEDEVKLRSIIKHLKDEGFDRVAKTLHDEYFISEIYD